MADILLSDFTTRKNACILLLEILGRISEIKPITVEHAGFIMPVIYYGAVVNMYKQISKRFKQVPFVSV